MLEFRDEEEVLDDLIKEKDSRIFYLEKELRKLRSKERLISQVNSIVNKSSIRDDLYKTLFLYLTEMMDDMSQNNEIDVFMIKEYMENLLEDIQVEVFIGEALYSSLYGQDTEKGDKEDIHALYDLRTSDSFDIPSLLAEVECKSSIVELSNLKLDKLGITNCRGLAIWVMEPLLNITPGFVIFMLKGENKFLTPVEKEIITVFFKTLLPTVYGRILMKRVAEEALIATKASITDALTKLNNRQSFNEDYLNNPNVKSVDYFVTFLDLCRLKEVNDTHGHDIADEVLKQLAIKLREFANNLGGTAYRLGGDEFVVTIPVITNPEIIKEKTQNLQDNWKRVACRGVNGEFYTDISIGVYRPESYSQSKDNVVKNADALMYICKNDREHYKIQYNF